jgi:hypothetical protein
VFIAFLDLRYHRRQCPKCFMCLGDLVETFEVIQQNSSAIVTTMTHVSRPVTASAADAPPTRSGVEDPRAHRIVGGPSGARPSVVDRGSG